MTHHYGSTSTADGLGMLYSALVGGGLFILASILSSVMRHTG